ncbi:Maf family nucleotide pyrophosphatase [Ampullimonas aquatilis]|uniref:Maf family nucleotide pyrophosphatase n=1 Tax=Ampullimonas aquatilis TaxID=1341549 RepID=UPI003C76C0CF
MKKILLLGSSSPYRQELLRRLKIPFQIISPNIDETPINNESPEATALRLSCEKAIAAANAWTSAQPPQTTTQLWVIGSDQVATCQGEQIGKPGTHAKAVEQLRRMSGQIVTFHSALCLAHTIIPAATHTSQFTYHLQKINVQTQVQYRKLNDAMIETYLRLDQPYDCAGSAKAESLGIALTERIESSDPTAITGLPLIALCTMLDNAGFDVLQEAQSIL